MALMFIGRFSEDVVIDLEALKLKMTPVTFEVCPEFPVFLVLAESENAPVPFI